MKALDPPRAQALLWRRAVWRGDWADAERLQPRDPALDGAIATYRALASGRANRQEAAASKVVGLPDDCCLVAKAELLTDLGYRKEAIEQLEKLVTTGPSGGPSINAAVVLGSPGLRSLWFDPAIEPLLRRVGLIDYWRYSATLPDVCRTKAAPAFCSSFTS